MQRRIDLTQAYIEKLSHIKKLGELLKKSEGQIYRKDYDDLLEIFEKLGKDPNNREYINHNLSMFVQNFRQIAITAELYKTNPESRDILLTAVGELEAIIQASV